MKTVYKGLLKSKLSQNRNNGSTNGKFTLFSPFTDISNNERFAKRKDPNNNDIQWSVKDIGRF